MEKMCSKCKVVKNFNEFCKRKSAKDGIKSECKVCEKQYREENKDTVYKRRKLYYKNNKEAELKSNKEYREKNKENINKKRKIYRENNKELIAKNKKIYYKNNKELLATKSKKTRKEIANYENYYMNLTIDESPILASNGISLEVKCKYCNKYFSPTYLQVRYRISALNNRGNTRGDCFLYCSEGCKDACPIFGQMKYPKGFKKASSREVNPLVRQLCFERDDWKCQICGATQKDAPLHCHHIEGYAKNPRLGNDVTNTITLCKTCHKEVHKLPGCSYYDSRCTDINIIGDI